jgi:hypothetical protein
LAVDEEEEEEAVMECRISMIDSVRVLLKRK